LARTGASVLAAVAAGLMLAAAGTLLVAVARSRRELTRS
jgi:LPXTG-motif cell wall-anchored protein